MVLKANRKRKSKGCFDNTSKKYLLENVVFKSCIGNHTINIDFFANSFNLYEKGIMPFKGNLGDQPSKIIELFTIIEQKKLEYNKENID